MRMWLAVAAIALCAGAFIVGRASVGERQSSVGGTYNSGYLAGREAAFAGYDGGWAYGAPYIVSLEHGGPGFTYRIARRLPLLPGVGYRLCGRQVCSTSSH